MSKYRKSSLPIKSWRLLDELSRLKKRKWKTVSLKNAATNLGWIKSCCATWHPPKLWEEKRVVKPSTPKFGGQVFVPFDQGLDINTLQRCHIWYSYSNSHPQLFWTSSILKSGPLEQKLDLWLHIKGPWSSFTQWSHRQVTILSARLPWKRPWR